MGIASWPPGERPREKLLERGAGSLSDAELLAIFLRVGAKGKSAVDLGRDLIERFGSLNGLFAAEPAAVAETSGVGPAKVIFGCSVTWVTAILPRSFFAITPTA